MPPAFISIFSRHFLHSDFPVQNSLEVQLSLWELSSGVWVFLLPSVTTVLPLSADKEAPAWDCVAAEARVLRDLPPLCSYSVLWGPDLSS